MKWNEGVKFYLIVIRVGLVNWTLVVCHWVVKSRDVCRKCVLVGELATSEGYCGSSNGVATSTLVDISGIPIGDRWVELWTRFNSTTLQLKKNEFLFLFFFLREVSVFFKFYFLGPGNFSSFVSYFKDNFTIHDIENYKWHLIIIYWPKWTSNRKPNWGSQTCHTGLCISSASKCSGFLWHICQTVNKSKWFLNDIKRLIFIKIKLSLLMCSSNCVSCLTGSYTYVTFVNNCQDASCSFHSEN